MYQAHCKYRPQLIEGWGNGDAETNEFTNFEVESGHHNPLTTTEFHAYLRWSITDIGATIQVVDVEANLVFLSLDYPLSLQSPDRRWVVYPYDLVQNAAEAEALSIAVDFVRRQQAIYLGQDPCAGYDGGCRCDNCEAFSNHEGEHETWATANCHWCAGNRSALGSYRAKNLGLTS